MIIFIGLSVFGCVLSKFGKEYHRKNSKKNYEVNKKLSELYKSIESNPGETFTQFKKRKKNSLGY